MRRLVPMVLVVAASCTLLTSFDPEGQPCNPGATTIADQCLPGYGCVEGACRKGAMGKLDGGVDAGSDGGVDSGVADAGHDAGHDAGVADAGDAGRTDAGRLDGGRADGGDAG